MESSQAAAVWIEPAALEEGQRGVLVLDRRGVLHGGVLPRSGGSRAELSSERLAQEARAAWEEARPIHLPAVLSAAVRTRRASIRASLELFERMRDEGSFQDEVWGRLEGDPRFEPAGVSVDLGDEREIEKVFANRVPEDDPRGKKLARDLYAKLSWISHDERDGSLRVRFSFGAEALLEWQTETARAPHADAYAQAVFPECSVLTENSELFELIELCAGTRVRASERIVYNNAPGGGAVFHNDDEPHQLGVLYGQLAGATGWLALPKLELAAELVEFTAGGEHAARAADVERAARWLEQGDEDPELLTLLNHTPAFTRRLIERGDFIHLRAGDVLLLPSPDEQRICWHSVFALGESPSLAHSYGLFGDTESHT